MDEIQTFCPSKSGSDQEKRLLGYLLILLDKLLDFKVVVIGITRDLESISTVLRRPGRYNSCRLCIDLFEIFSKYFYSTACVFA